MDAFAEWLSTAWESPGMYVFMDRFSWVDGLLFFFFWIGMAQGVKKGLLRKFSQVLELVLIICLCFRFFRPLGRVLREWIPVIPSETGALFAFIVLILITWYGIHVMDKKLLSTFHTELYAPLRRAGGGMMGCIHGVLIWSLVANAILLVPIWEVRKSFEEGSSYSGAMIAKIAPAVYKATFGAIGALGNEPLY